MEFLLTACNLFFLFLVFHAIADFPLQGDYMSRSKNPNDPIGKGVWFWVLPFHGVIHGGMVYFVTGLILLGVFETIAHIVIDWLKCNNKISYSEDQLLHIGCKLGYVLVVLGTGSFE